MLKRFGTVGIDEVDARASRTDPFAVATVDGDGVDLFAVEEVAGAALMAEEQTIGPWFVPTQMSPLRSSARQ